jgi:hypothetical protein
MVDCLPMRTVQCKMVAGSIIPGNFIYANKIADACFKTVASLHRRESPETQISNLTDTLFTVNLYYFRSSRAKRVKCNSVAHKCFNIVIGKAVSINFIELSEI